MSREDLRTWSAAYTLSIEVYVCADRYLMQDLKACIAAFIINRYVTSRDFTPRSLTSYSFEVAGLEAALPEVLRSCKTLYNGVSSMDPLLQARLFKNFQEETQAFFSENPELAFLIMKEMVERREEDIKDDLPSMERYIPLGGPPPPPPNYR
jgi:hypothetical protein